MALAPLAPETRNLIDGRLVEASNGASFENLNPATGEAIGRCSDGTKDDMEAALAAARRAFDETVLESGLDFDPVEFEYRPDPAAGIESAEAFYRWFYLFLESLIRRSAPTQKMSSTTLRYGPSWTIRYPPTVWPLRPLVDTCSWQKK